MPKNNIPSHIFILVLTRTSICMSPNVFLKNSKLKCLLPLFFLELTYHAVYLFIFIYL